MEQTSTLHDGFHRCGGIRFWEQLVPDQAGISHVLQTGEDAAEVDLSGARLVAAGGIRHMDGTLYLDERLFPRTAEFLEHIRATGGRYLYLTNNSSRGVETYVEKMLRLGIPAEPEDFFTSVDATVCYLREHQTPSDRYYVCGTESFKRQLRNAGFVLAERPEETVSTLLCGFDTELTFQKLEDACILLNRGAAFIATNPDWVCPTWYGYVPDCGSVCEMLTRATGRRPTVIGKPQPLMAQLAMHGDVQIPRQSGTVLKQTVLGGKCMSEICTGEQRNLFCRTYLRTM